MSELVVEPNQIVIGKAGDKLTVKALGSSLAICLYDLKNGIGGIAYTLLPGGEECVKAKTFDSVKYVDTCFPLFIKRILGEGAELKHICAKIVGGAQIFRLPMELGCDSIGKLNTERARDLLLKFRIPLIAEDTGDNVGRTIYFYPSTGIIKVKSVNREMYEI